MFTTKYISKDNDKFDNGASLVGVAHYSSSLTPCILLLDKR